MAKLFNRLIESNPLAIGLVALVLGALLALLIPETEQENTLLGPKRDQLASDAQESIRDLAHRASVVAQTAQSAAQDALDKTQGAAKDAINEAIGSIKEEADHQGLKV